MIGNNIATSRKSLKISQRELGRRTGLSGQMISKIENNSTHPSIETLDKIAKALNIDPSELLENEESNKKGIFSKFANVIDKGELKRSIDKYKAIDMFFKSLGYEIFMPTNEDGDYIFKINDVYYTPSQFETLLKMIETCIENTQNLLRDSED